jgi:hypothetical protein
MAAWTLYTLVLRMYQNGCTDSSLARNYIGLIPIAFPDESLAAIVLNKTNNIKRCSVAAYKINMLLARLFPMIPLVSANTARSSGFRAWIALCASWVCQLLPLFGEPCRAYSALESFERVHVLFVLVLVSANIIFPTTHGAAEQTGTACTARSGYRRVSVRLCISNLLIQLEIVGLERLDFCSEI